MFLLQKPLDSILALAESGILYYTEENYISELLERNCLPPNNKLNGYRQKLKIGLSLDKRRTSHEFYQNRSPNDA